MTDNLASYCSALIGQYNDNMKRLVEESTEMIFTLALKNPNLQVLPSSRGEIKIGGFYLIKYNYNGNRLWCPIFVIDDRYNPELQKRLIYSINLDYLPFRYKIAFFDKLFKMYQSVIDKNKINNDNNNSANDELTMKVNFESIYQSLKTNGNFNYCITAYDYSKIDGMQAGTAQIYRISTTIISRFLFIDSKIINRIEMENYMKESEVESEKVKILEILAAYDKTISDYENEVKEYYQKLRALENKYKLYENTK